MILYSFNANSAANTATAPKVSFRWQGFTTEWWRQWNGVPDLTLALRNSIFIAVTSTIVAAILGTFVALALVRYRFRGEGGLEFVLFLNIAAPEIVLGAGLLAFFALLNTPRGLLTIFIAHVMFNIAFVAVTVRARLAGYGRELEEAAQDLYAGAGRDVRQGHSPPDLAGDRRGCAPGVRALDRGLRDHKLRGRPDADVPALGLRRREGGDPSTGVRDGHRDLRRRRARGGARRALRTTCAAGLTTADVAAHRGEV
jgi:hypothetical protein